MTSHDARSSAVGRNVSKWANVTGDTHLVPLLSFWVFNGKSHNDRDAVQPKSLARQLRIVQDTAGIEAIVFWSAWQMDEMRTAKEPVEQIVIADFLFSVGSLPWPGCTSHPPPGAAHF